MTAARKLAVLLAGLGLVPIRMASAAAPPPEPAGGSTAFCLFELPGEYEDRKRWVNLGVVQYVEAGRHEVRIAYGGGNFGGGYEARIPVASAGEALAVVDRMRKAAAACR